MFICEVEHRPAVTLMVKIRQIAPQYEIKLLNLEWINIFSIH